MYKVCFINDNVFECILSFLSNQSLTKLQAVTGDHYLQCDSTLSKYCCACENDNPVRLNGLCTDCATNSTTEELWTTAATAKALYGLTAKMLTKLEHKSTYNSKDTFVDLDSRMIDTCGSKVAWLKEIAARDLRLKNRNAKRVFPIGFKFFVKKNYAKVLDHDALIRSGKRYTELKQALEARGCQLYNYNRHYVNYIMEGVGICEEIVDNMANYSYRFVTGLQ